MSRRGAQGPDHHGLNKDFCKYINCVYFFFLAKVIGVTIRHVYIIFIYSNFLNISIYCILTMGNTKSELDLYSPLSPLLILYEFL